MFQLILFLLVIYNSFLFLILNHPLSMGLTLMIQTFLLAIYSGIFTNMFWFSYSLFLIFMGGMLILFMYMTSLASNEMFKLNINFKYIIMNIIFLLTLFFFIYLLDMKMLMNNQLLTNNENSSIFIFSYSFKNNLMLNKMYNFPMNFITILLVNYLFLTLIATVKVTNIMKGPLRPKTF